MPYELARCAASFLGPAQRYGFLKHEFGPASTEALFGHHFKHNRRIFLRTKPIDLRAQATSSPFDPAL